MDTGKQFRSAEPAASTPRVYGQMVLPGTKVPKEKVARPAPEARQPHAQARLAAGEHPVDVYHGGTFPMMMTGGEVRHQFQPLDGDMVKWNTALTERIPETPPEMYDRKHAEAHGHKLHGGRVAASIAKTGYNMAKPIPLSSGTGSGITGSPGSQGKYQVMDGHHRVAVMSRDHPDQLASVSWHPNMSEYRGHDTTSAEEHLARNAIQVSPPAAPNTADRMFPRNRPASDPMPPLASATQHSERSAWPVAQQFANIKALDRRQR